MAALFCIAAEFSSASDLLNAAKQVKESGYKDFDVYSPFPIHGMDDAMGLKGSCLGWLALAGGLSGCAIGLGLQVWSSKTAYALIISGKPLASYPAFLPVTFELTILLTAFAVVFGMFALNKLPQWYHGIFNYSGIDKVTCDGFVLSIEATDAQFDETKTAAFLKSIGGQNVEGVEAL